MNYRDKVRKYSFLYMAGLTAVSLYLLLQNNYRAAMVCIFAGLIMMPVINKVYGKSYIAKYIRKRILAYVNERGGEATHEEVVRHFSKEYQGSEGERYTNAIAALISKMEKEGTISLKQ